jgi:hypothetical protein
MSETPTDETNLGDCIEVRDHEGNKVATGTVADLAQYEIQDEEIALRILRELSTDGSYDFTGDGEDPATDTSFHVIDQATFAAQLSAFEELLSEE